MPRAASGGMRLLVAATAAALFVQCGRSPDGTSASTGTPAPPATDPPSPAADAASDTDAATVVDAAAPTCIQPTSANPPMPVASGPAPGCPPDPGGDPNGPIVRVVFPDASDAVIEAELVSSQQDLERGLMYRTSLPANQGMLFDMQVTSNYQLWMHDTCLPLDMIFAAANGLIVGIVENAPALNDAPRQVGCPSRYVLEVNAGWSRTHGVKAGQQMTLPQGK